MITMYEDDTVQSNICKSLSSSVWFAYTAFSSALLGMIILSKRISFPVRSIPSMLPRIIRMFFISSCASYIYVPTNKLLIRCFLEVIKVKKRPFGVEKGFSRCSPWEHLTKAMKI
jgi:hypothetical protein